MSIYIIPSTIQAFIIAHTSEFIPRLMYQYGHSQDGTQKGYVNFTLTGTEEP